MEGNTRDKPIAQLFAQPDQMLRVARIWRGVRLDLYPDDAVATEFGDEIDLLSAVLRP